MKRDDKGINRRAFPKFLLWVLLGGVLGFFAGLAVEFSDLHLAGSRGGMAHRGFASCCPLGNPCYLRRSAGYLAWDSISLPSGSIWLGMERTRRFRTSG